MPYNPTPGIPSFTTDYQAPGDLRVGSGYPTMTKPIVLLAGVSYAYGTVLGRIKTGTNADCWTISVAAAVDGSQVPAGILELAIDLTIAGTGNTNCWALVSGEVDQDLLVYGAGHTAQTVADAFTDKGQPLYLKSVTKIYP